MEKYFLGFDDPYFEENYKRAVEFIPDLQKHLHRQEYTNLIRIAHLKVLPISLLY